MNYALPIPVWRTELTHKVVTRMWQFCRVLAILLQSYSNFANLLQPCDHNLGFVTKWSKPSLASQTFFVGGAFGEGKRTSGNTCQYSEFWSIQGSHALYHMPSIATRAPSRARGEPVTETYSPLPGQLGPLL